MLVCARVCVCVCLCMCVCVCVCLYVCVCSFDDELQPCSVVQVTSDSYLSTVTVSIVLLSMVSFVLQPCTDNEQRLSFNGNNIYSSVFF